MRKLIINLTVSAMFLAIALLLPLLTGQLQQLGSALLPMHIPVLLCGLICGPAWGASVGLIAPILRSAIFGMPPMMPIGLAMTFELLTYGLVIGLVYMLLPKKPWSLWVSLIAAMIVGRIVWGVAMMSILGISGTNVFTMQAFLSGAVLTAIPGIVVQIILIPSIMLVLERTKVLSYQKA